MILVHAQEVLEDALKLPENERAKLAASLLESLERPADEGVEEAWRAEVHRRVRDLDAGLVATVDWDEAHRRILR